MTVLRVHENPGIKGGSEVYIRDVMAELEDRGIRNQLLIIERKESGFRLHFQGEEQDCNGGEELVAALEKMLKGIVVDLVHIHGLSERTAVRFFLSRFKTVRTMHEPRMVCPGYSKFWTVSGVPCTKKFGLHCFWRAYSEKCMRSRKPANVLDAYLNTVFEAREASLQYAAVLTMSEYIRNEAIIGGVPEEKVICNPHFTKFKLPFIQFKGERKNFLFVGRLLKHKGVLELMQGMLPVLQAESSVTLTIVGDGPLYRYVQDFVDQHKVRSKVEVLKWKPSDEISALMKEAYAVLFPSIYPEAFGLVGIEAAMHSKPVIAFNTGGVSTWLEDGKNGFLLNEVSSSALTAAIKKLLDAPDEYARLAYNAWERANAYFTPQRHVDRLIEVYAGCLSAAI
ncbi:glycosyltransferase family 4 protein [Parasegetibacter sp. NRK P23]|uniref:glycosyltransferase family 4 protein n=1 Tax=Parasegetibacter sp. NRK P23 TaxID=2942999 RepID=UPI0020445327|nr:glycosyltransferase family 4 protein [Parasegetibacter sp. NRK P23]MCM5527631.1 glycosyltransferase family 4 protein [Parasegetibacter sp. NRK P23]